MKFQYATSVTKYDRRGYKPRERILLISSAAVYLYDAKDLKLKLHLPLNQLPGVTITNMGTFTLIL